METKAWNRTLFSVRSFFFFLVKVSFQKYVFSLGGETLDSSGISNLFSLAVLKIVDIKRIHFVATFV